MKRVRWKNVKTPIKTHRQKILGQAFGTDRKQVKPFGEDDREEDRRFETSLSGFRYQEEKHEASRYFFKKAARVTELTVKAKLGNPVSKSREKIVAKALVDTGSTFTVLPVV